MSKARNRARYPQEIKERARSLRAQGRTHREISQEYAVSLGTAHIWTRDIKITPIQKQAIQERRHQHEWTTADRAVAKKRLASFQFQKLHSLTSLLQKIRDFHKATGRIPLKAEFNSWRLFATHFGSWNKAIRAAGFDPNTGLFSRKFTANDGHKCDSFSEKIIDDWLSLNAITHERNVRYPGTRFTADFGLKTGIILEYFGLAGVVKEYDTRAQKKRLLARKLTYQLIEVYPNDIYPENKLAEILTAAGVISK
jgi:hypothetical protein